MRFVRISYVFDWSSARIHKPDTPSALYQKPALPQISSGAGMLIWRFFQYSLCICPVCILYPVCEQSLLLPVCFILWYWIYWRCDPVNAKWAILGLQQDEDRFLHWPGFSSSLLSCMSVCNDHSIHGPPLLNCKG